MTEPLNSAAKRRVRDRKYGTWLMGAIVLSRVLLDVGFALPSLRLRIAIDTANLLIASLDIVSLLMHALLCLLAVQIWRGARSAASIAIAAVLIEGGIQILSARILGTSELLAHLILAAVTSAPLALFAGSRPPPRGRPNRTIVAIDAGAAVTVLLVALCLAGAFSYFSFNHDEPTALTGSELERLSKSAVFAKLMPDLSGQRRRPWEKGYEATVVSFWASWCLPCLAEMKSLNDLSAIWKTQNVRVVLVNVDLGNVDTAARFLSMRNIQLECLVDIDSQVWSQASLTALPTTALLDADGNVSTVHIGAASSLTLSRDIDDLLRKERHSPAVKELQ